MKKFLVFALLIIFIQNFIYAADCNIDWGVTYQTINGFGGSSAWSEWSECPCGTNSFLVNNAEQFFSETNGIGLTIIRARIPPDQGQWGSTVAPLQAARDYGAKVMATAWTPPATWKSNGRVDNSDGGYLLPQYYQNYADYLTNYVKTLKNNYNIDLYAISPANEPDYQVSYDGCSWTGAQLRDFIKNNLGPTFAANNITTKILVPESFKNDCSYADTILGDATARNYVFGIAQHFYGGGPTYCSSAGAYNKEFWQTEKSSFETYDATMTHGLATANWIHNCLVNANYNVFLYWWLASDSNNEGLRSVNNGVPKRFWVMGNFSKFIRPGFVRISCSANPTSGVYVSAYKDASTGDFAIVVINTNSSTISNQKFNLTAMSVTSVTPYLTDSSNDLVKQSSVSVSGNSFTYNLPARSVITFVGVSGNVTVSPTETWTITLTPTPVTGVLLDDFEDCDGTNNWGGSWYTYNDNNSTLSPNPFSTTSGGVDGSTICSVQVTGNIASGGYGGLGTNLNSGETAVDLTSYAGIEFYVRGDGGTYWIQFTQPSITNGDFYGVTFTAPSNWTKVQVFFETSGLNQRGWGASMPFTQNEIIAIQWTNYSSGALNFQIDDVKLISSQPYTATPTNTYTRTNTATQTRTNTLTNTPTDTNTTIFTNTLTLTPTFTRTSTSTATNTNTPTDTFTAIWTFTMTSINTQTATNTQTFIITNTATQTRTNTNTIISTDTETLTQTFTRTFTSSPINTFTMTSTNTQTATNTQTFVIINTATETGTNTPTNLQTNTNTIIPTNTETPTQTFTNTRTITETYIITNTETPTPTNTQVQSNTNTATETATLTPTFTFTLLPTFTSTSTSTNTVIPSASYTNTLTNTSTSTNTFTSTLSETPANTNTSTKTMTVVVSYTATTSYTVTPGYTPTPTDTVVEEEVIKDVQIYSHPVDLRREVNIKFYLGKKVKEVRIKIYTVSLRKVVEGKIGGEKEAGINYAIVPRELLRNLANGIYYFVLEGEVAGRGIIESNIKKMVIVK